MESKSKFLSVIVVYDQQDYSLLERTLESISSQSRHDVDVIVVDIVGSLNQEDRLFKRLNVNVINDVNLSYFEALNIGVSNSSTKWVNVLKLGSTYTSSSVFENVISIIKSNDAHIYYGDSFKVINNELGTCKIISAKSVEEISKEETFHLESCIFKTEILKLYKFNSLYEYAAEYDLLIRLYKDDVSFAYLPLTISKSSFSKSFNERVERLFIISKYFGDKALIDSTYFKPFIRLGNSEVKRVARHISNIDGQIREREPILQERCKEFNEIKNTLTYKLGKLVYGLLNYFPWRHR